MSPFPGTVSLYVQEAGQGRNGPETGWHETCYKGGVMAAVAVSDEQRHLHQERGKT